MSDNKILMLWRIPAIGAIAWVLAPSASASLGGSVASIEADRKALQGKVGRVAVLPDTQSGYTVHEISQDGNKIREYALPDGTVFAVNWRGITQPDLTVLLGKFYREFEDAVSEPPKPGIRRKGRASRVIRTPHIVTERSGHMRDVRGKAYIPALMPEGVGPEDIFG